jgi:hypothetical protein
MHPAAPIAAAGLGAVATVYVALEDPSAPGSHFPACQFRALTGLWCPGCGLTRGVHELLHGHVGVALGLNLFTPLAVVITVAAWVTWLLAAWGRPTRPLPQPAATRASWVLLGLLVTYGVLRNLPLEPFRALAP